MKRVARKPVPPSDRLLRRVVLLLMVAICGLLAGVIAWPILRTTWYIRQARSEEAEPRVAGINALGGLCAREPHNADAARGFVAAGLSYHTAAVLERLGRSDEAQRHLRDFVALLPIRIGFDTAGEASSVVDEAQ